MKSWNEYFALYEPRPVLSGDSGGLDRVKQPLYFVGVLAGAFALILIDWINDGGSIQIKSFLVAAIMSILSFPYIYENAGLKTARMSFAKWCLAFQYGFFWPAIFQKIQSGFSG